MESNFTSPSKNRLAQLARGLVGACGVFFGFCLLLFGFQLFKTPELREHVFIPRGLYVNMMPVELGTTPLSEQQFKLATVLRFESPLKAETKTISFWLATWNRNIAFQRAALNFGERSCEAEIPGGQIQDNSFLTFTLPTGCSPHTLQEPVELSIITAEPVKIALWAKETGGEWLPASALKIAVGQQQDKRSVFALGSYTLQPPSTASRFHSLAAAWNIPPALLGAIFALALLASALLTHYLLHKVKSESVNALVLLPLLGLMGALWCLIIPPLQAPDEPCHLLSFASFTRQSSFVNEKLLHLAQRTHFERIKFNSQETLHPADLQTPTTAGWAAHIGAPDYAERAPVMAGVIPFFLLGLNFETVPAEALVLGLRLINILLISAALGATALALKSTLLPAAFLLTPPLLFFGMHVSNYPTSMAFLVPVLSLAAMSLLQNRSGLKWLLLVLIFFTLSFFSNKTIAQIFPYLSAVAAIGVLCALWKANVLKFVPWPRMGVSTHSHMLLLALVLLTLVAGVGAGYHYTPLPAVEFNASPPHPVKQAVKAALVFLTGWLGVGSDYHSNFTFWSGLGWLDAAPQQPIAALPRYLWLFCWIFVFVRIVKAKNALLGLKLGGATLALLASVAFLSYMLQTKVTVNLSGRYLIPVYMAFFTLTVVALETLFKEASLQVKKSLCLMALSLGCGFHLLYLSSMLVRYYG